MLALPTLLLTLPSWAPPQDPPPLPPDLQALAAQVETAHRPRGPVARVTAFRGDLELHLLDPTAEQRGQVDLAVRFLETALPGSSKVRALIRYEVRDAGSPIVRGRDRYGPWQLFQGEPKDITGPSFVQDREQCERHTNLAKQLVRFLSPGEVLLALQQPGPVTEQVLAIDRATRVPCLTVAGDLPAFPLLQLGGDDAPAHVQVFVGRATGRLVAIDAWPLVDGKRDPGRGERIVLRDLHERDGLLVPRELVHLFRLPDGTLRLQSMARLSTLSLFPELRVEDFDRSQ